MVPVRQGVTGRSAFKSFGSFGWRAGGYTLNRWMPKRRPIRRVCGTVFKPASASDDRGLRQQAAALRDLVVLSSVLTEQSEVTGILHLVARAAPSLARCRTCGIVLDGHWHEVSGSDQGRTRALERRIEFLDSAQGGRLPGPDVAWTWAYPLSTSRHTSGYLVVSAEVAFSTAEHFLLQALAQQAGVAVATAVLYARERDQAEQLQAANRALQRSMAIHERLTRVAPAGEGANGIARLVHDLSGLPTAIEDGDGNLWAWAGPGRRAPYPRQPAGRRDALLRMARTAGRPVRDGSRLISVARVGNETLAVLALVGARERNGETERVILEHATTLLTMELARATSQKETELPSGCPSGAGSARPGGGNRPSFGWASLTESEARIAELVAQGLTNREVAEDLFVSRHTVDSHLRQMFRKLAITSRVQLARLVIERGRTAATPVLQGASSGPDRLDA